MAKKSTGWEPVSVRISLVSLQSSKDLWFVEACELYQKKLQAFCRFESHALKAKGRSQGERRKQEDSEQILQRLSPQAFVVLCDERGQSFNSQQFSKQLLFWWERNATEVCFVIGGAYGASESLHKRANAALCLAPWVMNHHVAQVVLLEQIYRAMSIWKGLPYHNE